MKRAIFFLSVVVLVGCDHWGNQGAFPTKTLAEMNFKACGEMCGKYGVKCLSPEVCECQVQTENYYTYNGWGLEKKESPKRKCLK